MQSMNTSSTGSKLRIPQQRCMTALQTKYFLWRKCRCVMEFRNLSHALRHSSIGLLVDNYSVFYIVRVEAVIVTNVLYSASDLETRLCTRHESKTD